MIFKKRLLVTALLIMGMEGMLSASIVKKRNGQIVEGEIGGVIIQKGDVSKSDDGFTVKYFPINGKEIVAIDEIGIHLAPGSASVVFIVDDKESLPPDIDVLKAALRRSMGPRGMEDPLGIDIVRDELLEVIPIRGGNVSMGSFWVSEKNYFWITKEGENRSANKDAILGTVQINNKEISLIPSLNISTAQGDVAVNVDDIVEYRQ